MPADPRLAGGELYRPPPPPPATTTVRRIPRSNDVTTVGGVGSPITVPYVPPVIRAEDRPTQTTGFEIPVDEVAELKNINPYGGTTYGGGGSSTTPGLDQRSLDSMLGMMRGTRPLRYDHTPIDLPEYNAPAFYEFDSGMYDTARQGIQTGISDARQMGNTAFDRSMQRYQNYQDPFASGPREYNPGVDPRLLASMQAWGGAGSNAAAETFGEGVQADSAMGSVYDLLSKVGTQFNQGQLAGIEGDRMQFEQRLGSEGRMMELGVEMALARAKSQYQKDLFAYGKEEADRRFEIAMQEALMNNQGVNQANQANIGAANAHNQGIVGPLLELILAGRDSKGKQGLDLTAIPGMTQWEMNR